VIVTAKDAEDAEENQEQNYLKLAERRLGLLFNFHVLP